MIKEKRRKSVICCCDTLVWCQLLSPALVLNADNGWWSVSDGENWEEFFLREVWFFHTFEIWRLTTPRVCNLQFCMIWTSCGPAVSSAVTRVLSRLMQAYLFCVLITVYLLTLDYFWLLDYCWHRVNSTVPLLSDVVTVMYFVTSNSSGSSFFPEIEQIGVNCHSCG